VDFVVVLIELFGLGVTVADAVTSENKLKIGVLQTGGSVSAKFSRRRGRPPPIIYTRIDGRMNALQLCRCYSYSYSLWLIVKDSNVTLNMPTRCGHPI